VFTVTNWALASNRTFIWNYITNFHDFMAPFVRLVYTKQSFIGPMEWINQAPECGFESKIACDCSRTGTRLVQTSATSSSMASQVSSKKARTSHQAVTSWK
jgi:hypothetical protein